jgi:hypothetical protein
VRSLGGRGHLRRPGRPGTDDVGGAVSTAIPWPARSRPRASRETPRSARRRRRVVGDDVQAAEASSTTARRHRVPRPPRGRAAAPNGLIPRDATRAERRARGSPSGCGRTGQARQAVSSLGSAGELTAPATPGGPIRPHGRSRARRRSDTVHGRTGQLRSRRAGAASSRTVASRCSRPLPDAHARGPAGRQGLDRPSSTATRGRSPKRAPDRILLATGPARPPRPRAALLSRRHGSLAGGDRRS